MGLDGLLAGRAAALTGILNGIDTDVWDPAADPAIAVRFDAATLSRRAGNKAAVQAAFGLAGDPDALLLGIVSRLTDQKGMDLVLAAIPDIVSAGAQLVVLGSGDPAHEAGFRAAAAAHPDRIGCRIGYDEALAHQIQAGVDALLVPSRFEPCGLTQLCALRYGAVPIVTRIGGLADTIVDANPAAMARGVATGIQIGSVEALRAGITLASDLYRDRKVWGQLQQNGMATDISWTVPAARYAALFRSLVKR